MAENSNSLELENESDDFSMILLKNCVKFLCFSLCIICIAFMCLVLENLVATQKIKVLQRVLLSPDTEKIVTSISVQYKGFSIDIVCALPSVNRLRKLSWTL